MYKNEFRLFAGSLIASRDSTNLLVQSVNDVQSPIALILAALLAFHSAAASLYLAIVSISTESTSSGV